VSFISDKVHIIRVNVYGRDIRAAIADSIEYMGGQTENAVALSTQSASAAQTAAQAAQVAVQFHTDGAQWMADVKVEILEWYLGIKGTLGSDAAASLALAVEEARPKALTLTIAPAQWSSGRYTVTSPMIKATSTIMCWPAPGSDTAAYKRAGLTGDGQQDGSAVIKCTGTVPTVPISVFMVVLAT
jgi:hypothetical protein